MHMDVLDRDLLLTLATMAVKRLDPAIEMRLICAGREEQSSFLLRDHRCYSQPLPGH